MKVISVSVSEKSYEAFRQVAGERERPVAELIREAMDFYLQEKVASRPSLRDLPVLSGHRQMSAIPARTGIYDEMFSARGGRKR